MTEGTFPDRLGMTEGTFPDRLGMTEGTFPDRLGMTGGHFSTNSGRRKTYFRQARDDAQEIIPQSPRYPFSRFCAFAHARAAFPRHRQPFADAQDERFQRGIALHGGEIVAEPRGDGTPLVRDGHAAVHPAV